MSRPKFLYKQGFFANMIAPVASPKRSIGICPQDRKACSLNATTNMLKSRSTVHKPGRLNRGGRIGVLATAGIVEPKSLEAGIAAIRAEGFEVELSKQIFDGKGYLAGESKERAKELVDFFRRSDIDAIFCARGGFGSMQILPYLGSELKGYPT